tara:strand:+ start:2338 stop:3837 length:1500 start_codon:yes stop_codon:yes gene_type:complete
MTPTPAFDVLWNEIRELSTRRSRKTYVDGRVFETQRQAATFLGVSVSHLSNALALGRSIQGHSIDRDGDKLEFRTHTAMQEARQGHAQALPSLDRRLMRCWDDQRAVYHQSIKNKYTGMQLNLLSSSTRDAVEIRGLLDALSMVCGRELMKRKRCERKDNNHEKRARDVSRTGDNQALERRLLLAFHAYASTVHGFDELYVYVMPDFTRADALVRVSSMPPGVYVQVQWKTTHRKPYAFQKCAGYDDMILVMMCEEDGKIWACPGREVTRRTCGPAGTLPVLSNAQLHAYLVHACVSQAFPATTLSEAEGDVLNANQRKEYEHIHAYVQCVYGAIDFTERHDSDANKYRLTASGHVVKYPDGQALRHDLEVFSSLQDACDGIDPLRFQFKSAWRDPRCASYACTLACRRGVDAEGRVLSENTYRAGDADVYVVCQLDGACLQTWTFPERVLLEHGVIGTECNPTGIMCSIPSTGVRKTSSHWTREFYDLHTVDPSRRSA